MRLLRLLCFAGLGLPVIVAANPVLNTAGPQVSGVAYADKGELCNSTTAHANATGAHHFSPNYRTAQTALGGVAAGTIPNASWLVTVKEDYSLGSTQSTIWFNTNGQHYWDDERTQFDACAYILRPGLQRNAIRLGQQDPGDCTSTLSQGCRTALLEQAETSAKKWTQYASPVPYSNLSAGVLPTICQYIANDLGSGQDPEHPSRHVWPAPKECIKDFRWTQVTKPEGEFSSIPRIEIVQLTGPNKISYTGNDWLTANDPATDTNVNWDCSITDGQGRRYYSTLDFNEEGYDYQTRVVTPILSVYFNLANAEFRGDPKSYSASSQLSCLRVTDFAPGSRVSPRLPPGIPWPANFFNRLPRPALIGLVTTSVSAYVFVLGGGIMIIVVRNIRARKGKMISRHRKYKEMSEEEHVHELVTMERVELDGRDRKQEIDGVQILEIGSTHGAVELDPDTERRWSFSSSRPSLIGSFSTAYSTG